MAEWLPFMEVADLGRSGSVNLTGEGYEEDEGYEDDRSSIGLIKINGGAPSDEFIVEVNFDYCEVEYQGHMIVDRETISVLNRELDSGREVYTPNMPGSWCEEFEISELKGAFTIHSEKVEDVEAMRKLFGERIGNVQLITMITDMVADELAEESDDDDNDDSDEEIPARGHTHLKTHTEFHAAHEDYLIQLLVEGGHLTPEHVAEIRGKLGDDGLIQHFLDHGDVTETAIAEVSAANVGTHVADLANGFIDPALKSFLSLADCRHFNAVPFYDDGSYLSIALADVLDFEVQDAIPHIVNRECQFFAATPKGIQGALEQIFGDEAGEAPL